MKSRARDFDEIVYIITL